MEQLIKPNLSIIGEIGECLHYAGSVFGVFSGPNTAWEAWEQTKYQHTDQNFPKGVSFPVWFSGAGGDGHVAVYTPNGIYSSPWEQGTSHAVLTSIAQVEELYHVKYAGWSEDIEGKRVIEGVNMTDKQLHDIGTYVYRSMLFREPEDSSHAISMGKRFVSGSSITSSSFIAGVESVMGSSEWQGDKAKVHSSPAPATLNKASVEAYIHVHLT